MRHQRRPRTLILAAATASLLTLLSVGLLQGPAACNPASRSTPTTPAADARTSLRLLPSPALAHAAAKAARVASVADVAERALPSVVNISTTKVVRTPGALRRMPFFSDPFFRYFFGPPGHSFRMPREQRERSLGSGVVVSADGIVLTNNHVVSHASEIRVTLSDRREFKAKLIGADPKSDVAVIRLQGKVQGLRPIPIGDSAKLRLGDFVLAIGNPFGVGQTVTLGIVSAKGRANVGIVDYEDFIQTDAAINPGNSGGALVNLRGELVGINTAILSRSGGYQGIGFAIPTNMAKPIMQSLIRYGKVVRGYLGVMIQDLTPALAKAMGMAGVRGVLVSDVLPGSPAAKAGLKRGDVILKVAGERVRDSAHLRNLVAGHGAHARVKLLLRREGNERTVDVTLGELPGEKKHAARLRSGAGPLSGLDVETLDKAARSRLGVPERIPGGVVVKQVQPGSPAAQAGLRPGDVIVEVNRTPVRTAQAFARLARQKRSTVVLLVFRRGGLFYVVIH